MIDLTTRDAWGLEWKVDYVVDPTLTDDMVQPDGNQLCAVEIKIRTARRREPNDAEFSTFRAYRNHLHTAVYRVQDTANLDQQGDWSVTRMAQVAHTSPRQLIRLFIKHATIAPLQYLLRIRLAVAQTAPQSGSNVGRAAASAGFSSDTHLRRTWHQFGLAGTPGGLC